MDITEDIICHSVAQHPFGNFEPFVTGNEVEVWQFFADVLSALEQVPGVSVVRELDHHGSGYASYISAFLYPSDGSTRYDRPLYFETTGILLYMSRLAPIAVYGASGRSDNKDDNGSSSGFIDNQNVGTLPRGDWTAFIAKITDCLRAFRVEVLPREPLLQPAPEGIEVPTVFNGPYYIFDTLFYWCD